MHEPAPVFSSPADLAAPAGYSHVVSIPSGRLVWTAVTEQLTHYNASVQVFDDRYGSRVVWVADFLPDTAREWVQGMIQQGMAAMKTTLDASE